MASAPPTTSTLLTAEEFALRHDPGHPEELVKGRVVAMPPPGFQHGRVCAKAVRLLGNDAEDRDLGHVVSNDAGVDHRARPRLRPRARHFLLPLRAAPEGGLPEGLSRGRSRPRARDPLARRPMAEGAGQGARVSRRRGGRRRGDRPRATHAPPVRGRAACPNPRRDRRAHPARAAGRLPGRGRPVPRLIDLSTSASLDPRRPPPVHFSGRRRPGPDRFTSRGSPQRMAETSTLAEANPLRQGAAAGPRARALHGRPVRGHRRPGPSQARPARCTTWRGAATCRASTPSSASPAATGPTTSSATTSPPCSGTTGELRVRPSSGPEFASHIVFAPGTFDDPPPTQSSRTSSTSSTASHGTRGNRLYYLAVAPEFFATIIEHLGKAGLIYPTQQESPWSRVVIEKPFGHDLASATR